MRLATIFAILVISSAMVRNAAADDVRWHNSIEAAQKIAAQSGRMVLVHFWSPSCAPCKRLEHNVYSKVGTGSAIETNFVPVKINTHEYPSIAQAYGVEFVPTDVVLSSAGEKVAIQRCPQSPELYLAGLARAAVNGKSRTQGAYDAIAGGVNRNNPIHQVAAQQPVSNTGQGSQYANYNNTAGADPRYTNTPPPVERNPYLNLSNNPATRPANPPQQNPGAYQQNLGAPQNYARPQQNYTGQPGVGGQGVYGPPPIAQNPQYKNGVQQLQDRYPTRPPAGNLQRPPLSPPIQQQQQQQPSRPQNQIVHPNPQRSVPPQQANPQPSGPLIALDGHCPVELASKEKWIKGDRRYGAVHRGQTFLFAGPEQQSLFLASPDQYSPALAGNDPVLAFNEGKFVPGRRAHGLFYNKRVYLFSSEASITAFYREPVRFADAVQQAEAVQPGAGTQYR